MPSVLCLYTGVLRRCFNDNTVLSSDLRLIFFAVTGDISSILSNMRFALLLPFFQVGTRCTRRVGVLTLAVARGGHAELQGGKDQMGSSNARTRTQGGSPERMHARVLYQRLSPNDSRRDTRATCYNTLYPGHAYVWSVMSPRVDVGEDLV